MKYGVDDITGVVGILPTPATADADRWDARNTVNLAETEKMVRAVVDAGVNIIMTTGTFGECATLMWDELQALVACVVDVTAQRRPVFAGVTTLNTRDTIERARQLIDLGADGLFVGRPMWLALDQKQIVQYYTDLAHALPGVPLVIYDNPLAFKGKIASETYAQLALIPEAIAAKHVGGAGLERDIETVGNNLRMLPLDNAWLPVAQSHPTFARACWSGFVACGPWPVTELSRAILSQDWSRAAAIHERILWAGQPLFPAGDFATFMDYSIQLTHIRLRTAGLIDPGPCRRPYNELPDTYVEGAEECGRRWAEISAEYGGANRVLSEAK